ncbi:MAG: ATP-binding protein [Kiritimatiellales bacterium]|jgi:heavy metal sensor kinase
MCSNKHSRLPRTVVARLTFWYAIICTLFCITIFSVVSIKMSSNAGRRMDRLLGSELTEFAGIYKQKGVQELQDEFTQEAEANGINKLFFRLLSPQQELMAASDTSGWDHLEKEIRAVPLPTAETPVFSTLYDRNNPLNARMAAVRTFDGSVLQIGFNLHFDNRSREKIQRILIVSSLTMTVLGTLFGWLIARRAMSGVQRVTQAVSRIRKGRLNQQVPFGNEGREIDELAGAFNEMLNRIESLVRELKEVSDNVAHDLRSPVTRMRGVAETTLTGPQEISAYREMGLTIIEESERLTQMINTTLEIAQAETGLLEINRTPLDLTTLLKNAIDLFQPLAEEKQINLRANLPEDPLIIFGDKTRIQRTIANLIDNAIKYTKSGGDITIAAFIQGTLIRIEISDSGIGIDPEESDRIFERFYRSEKSRSSQGNGLGLSLARTIVEAHGGTISVKSAPGKGSTFTITLPRGIEQR